MFTKSDIETISTVFGKTVDEVSGAMSSEEEVALDLKIDGQILSDKKIQDLKAKEDIGEKKGREIHLKKLAKLFDIELSKDDDKFADKLAPLIEAKLKARIAKEFETQTPTEELANALNAKKEAEEKYNKLKETQEETLRKLDEANQKFNDKVAEIEENNVINTFRANLQDVKKITPDDAVIIAKNTFKTEKDEEGIEYVKRGDVIQRKSDGTYESIDNVLKSFIEEKQWIEGSGVEDKSRKIGENEHPKGLSHDEAVKYVREKGLHEMEKEGSLIYSQVVEQ